MDEEAIQENTNPDRSPSDDVEEAVMVAFDRSGESGELRIVTDPEEIKSIELEEQERKRNVRFTFGSLEIVSFMIILSQLFTADLHKYY